MKIATIVPARGGSKGIPNKNIAPLLGRPLLAYTVEAALESGVSDAVWVSTDSEAIAEAARNCGAQVIMRPDEFSHDTASTESALLHALDFLQRERSLAPDAVLTLPATSPMRTAATIRSFVEHYAGLPEDYDALLSLTEDRGDYWVRNSGGEFARLFPEAPRRRQERAPLVLENSALYMTRTSALRETGFILGTRCAGYPIDPAEAADINVPRDLEWVEFLMSRRPRD